MNVEFSNEFGLCAIYEKLLTDCEQALDAWSARSEEVRKVHLTGVAIGRELLLLQARFAKAYAALRQHSKRCEHCRLQAKRVRLHAFANSPSKTAAHLLRVQ